MGRKADARMLLFERIQTSPPKFVHVTGIPYVVEREVCEDVERMDHVWITIEAPPFGRLRCTVNTLSRLSRDMGHDPRIRVGIVKGTWVEKPASALEECVGQDYAPLDHAVGVTYELYEPEALCALLLERAKAAVRVEVWGELYARETLGVHQIHSRRASSAVPKDIKNRDGALKLYYLPENVSELFLFKFAGQP